MCLVSEMLSILIAAHLVNSPPSLDSKYSFECIYNSENAQPGQKPSKEDWPHKPNPLPFYNVAKIDVYNNDIRISFKQRNSYARRGVYQFEVYGKVSVWAVVNPCDVTLSVGKVTLKPRSGVLFDYSRKKITGLLSVSRQGIINFKVDNSVAPFSIGQICFTPNYKLFPDRIIYGVVKDRNTYMNRLFSDPLDNLTRQSPP